MKPLESLIRLGRNLKNETERVSVCPSEKLASAYLEASEEISQLEGRIQELRTQRLSFLAKLPELMKFPKGGSRSTPTGEVTARAELLNIEEFLDKGLRQILWERRSGSLSDSEAEERWTNLLHDGFDFWEPSSATGRALLNIQKLTKRIILNHTALCRWKEHVRFLEIIADERSVSLSDVSIPVSPGTQRVKAQTNSLHPEKSSTGQREIRQFSLSTHGGKELCIVVSYAKAGNRNTKKLAMALTHKAHIRYPRRRYSYETPLDWYENNRKGFNNHTYKLREKAKSEGWWDNIPADYHRKYTGR